MVEVFFLAMRLLRFALVLGPAFLLFTRVEPALAGPGAGTYLPGQLLVKLNPGPPGRAQLAPAHPAGVRVKARMPKLGWQLLELPAGMSVADAME